MRFELRQRLIDGQYGDGDQLAHFVAERAGIAHFAEDEPLQYAHEFGVVALVLGRLSAEEFFKLVFAFFDPVHGF